MTPSSSNPRVDVVVVSYNSRDTLRDCVEPLAAMAGVHPIVVDNASPDDSLEVIRDLPATAIQAGRNGGFGFGCNVGLAAGSAPLVLFLNPDARIASEELDRMIAVLDAEPDVGLVGPRLLDDDGEIIPSQRRSQRPLHAWAQALFLHRLLPHARWANEIDTAPAAYDRVGYPEWISGAAMLGRRELLESIGGFDEDFFLYCEDMDLCARVREAGFKVRYEPGAVVGHTGGHSAPRSSLLPVMVESRLLYARKHSGPVSALLLRSALAVDALTHLLAGARRTTYARGHAAGLRVALRGTRLTHEPA